MAEAGLKKVPKKASARREFMRAHFFPFFSEDDLWLRKRKIGFTTIPRTMSLIGRIQDTLSEKGFPLSATYLTLWCWVFDEAFLEIRNPKEFAFESGFTGPRAETTWKNRMQRLQDLGFILSRPGLSGPFHNVLLLDPIKTIQKIYAGKGPDLFYDTLMSRLTQIGANDAVIEEGEIISALKNDESEPGRQFSAGMQNIEQDIVAKVHAANDLIGPEPSTPVFLWNHGKPLVPIPVTTILEVRFHGRHSMVGFSREQIEDSWQQTDSKVAAVLQKVVAELTG